MDVPYRKQIRPAIRVGTVAMDGILGPARQRPQSRSTHSDAIRFPNVLRWSGMGGHELRLVAGEMSVVRPLV
ncbi:hypothetical protein PV420_31350, partial [Streptomyces europaeiscabiei]|nr:hypothetical protein [Streptomyces europaeiscabiei]